MPTLYYDTVLNEGIYETLNRDSVIRNNQIIDSKLMESVAGQLTNQNLEGAFFQQAGQFICLSNISIDENRYEMQIFEVKDDDRFYKILNLFNEEHEDFRTMLIDVYNKKRQLNQEDFILVQGAPPAS
jgi:hypothetical protein